MTDLTKLADAVRNTADALYMPDSERRAELLDVERILRAADGVDVAGLIELAAKAIYESWFTQPGFVAWMTGGNSHKQTEARDIARAALESALRLALAARELSTTIRNSLIVVDTRGEKEIEVGK